MKLGISANIGIGTYLFYIGSAIALISALISLLQIFRTINETI